MSAYRRELADLAKSEGWTMEITGGCHVRLRHPTCGIAVIAPFSPRNPARTMWNLRARLRRTLKAVERGQRATSSRTVP